ncbi:hypothetical protein CAP35_10355 [Chitinophagaceae bacterium IBVUCB1]|nr:hypothetical protein CAP35_10355 [Chitinophagaceae bacterium IBVUCB1]
MDIKEIDIFKISAIKYQSFVTDDETTLAIKYSGIYGEGSFGNLDGIFMHFILAGHYFALNPMVIIIDLTELEYKWGNTISRIINFFGEMEYDGEKIDKKVLVITSKKNHESLNNLSTHLAFGQRYFFNSEEEAMQFAKKEIERYVE